MARSTVSGRFHERNLIGLGAQSKRFFARPFRNVQDWNVKDSWQQLDHQRPGNAGEIVPGLAHGGKALGSNDVLVAAADRSQLEQNASGLAAPAQLR
jgi:hypothetical protein